MQIDWFTTIAQVINFLVLIWLLKRFLYGKIVAAMNERESGIVSRLKEAERKQAEADKSAQQYRTAQQDLEEEREQMLLGAREEAETRRQQLVEAARKEVEQTQMQWFEALHQEKKQFWQDFREKIGQQIFSIASRSLNDLANVRLQDQMAVTFMDRLEQLDPEERETMVKAIRAADREVEVRSAFPMEAEMRERITQSLRTHIADSVDVRFEVEKALGCGIELYSRSHRLVWNVESYLENLEGEFFQGLENRTVKYG